VRGCRHGGSPVQRFYGIESLRIASDPIDLSRLQTTGIPVIDSHQQTSIDHALGKLTHASVSKDALHGVIKFNRTESGMRAEGMVRRDELAALASATGNGVASSGREGQGDRP
jgi:hypothetical protein